LYNSSYTTVVFRSFFRSGCTLGIHGTKNDNPGNPESVENICIRKTISLQEFVNLKIGRLVTLCSDAAKGIPYSASKSEMDNYLADF